MRGLLISLINQPVFESRHSRLDNLAYLVLGSKGRTCQSVVLSCKTYVGFEAGDSVALRGVYLRLLRGQTNASIDQSIAK
jgi:hypothetical protein